MKKSIKNLGNKEIKNLNAVKGGEGGKGNNNNPPYGGGQTQQTQLL